MAVSTTTTTSCATTFTSMLSSAWYVFCFACLNVFRLSKFSNLRTAIKGLFSSSRSGHEVHISESRVLAIKNNTNNTFVYARCPCRCSPTTTAWADLPQSSVEGLTKYHDQQIRKKGNTHGQNWPHILVTLKLNSCKTFMIQVLYWYQSITATEAI